MFLLFAIGHIILVILQYKREVKCAENRETITAQSADTTDDVADCVTYYYGGCSKYIRNVI